MKRITIITTALTGCGKSDEGTVTESTPAVTTVTEAVTTTAVNQTTAETASKDSSDNSNEEENTSITNNSESIGIDRETAISNVKELAGSGAKIVNVTCSQEICSYNGCISLCLPHPIGCGHFSV